jgi:hypothetical protein
MTEKSDILRRGDVVHVVLSREAFDVLVVALDDLRANHRRTAGQMRAAGSLFEALQVFDEQALLISIEPKA